MLLRWKDTDWGSEAQTSGKYVIHRREPSYFLGQCTLPEHFQIEHRTHQGGGQWHARHLNGTFLTLAAAKAAAKADSDAQAKGRASIATDLRVRVEETIGQPIGAERRAQLFSRLREALDQLEERATVINEQEAHEAEKSAQATITT
jgi:hypothetical protein